MKVFRSARMKYEEYLKSEKEKKSVSKKETQPSRYHPILKTYVASVAHLSEPLKCWAQILSSVLKVQRKRMT